MRGKLRRLKSSFEIELKFLFFLRFRLFSQGTHDDLFPALETEIQERRKQTFHSNMPTKQGHAGRRVEMRQSNLSTAKPWIRVHESEYTPAINDVLATLIVHCQDRVFHVKWSSKNRFFSTSVHNISFLKTILNRLFIIVFVLYKIANDNWCNPSSLTLVIVLWYTDEFFYMYSNRSVVESLRNIVFNWKASPVTALLHCHKQAAAWTFRTYLPSSPSGVIFQIGETSLWHLCNIFVT